MVFNIIPLVHSLVAPLTVLYWNVLSNDELLTAVSQENTVQPGHLSFSTNLNFYPPPQSPPVNIRQQLDPSFSNTKPGPLTRDVLANEQLGGFSSVYFLANPAAVCPLCLEKCENLVSVGTAWSLCSVLGSVSWETSHNNRTTDFSFYWKECL